LPSANRSGIDTFFYVVRDNGATNGVADPRETTGTVTVSLGEVNDPPQPQPNTVTTAEDTPATISFGTLMANDKPGPDPFENNQALEVTGPAAPITTAAGGQLVPDFANH